MTLRRTHGRRPDCQRPLREFGLVVSLLLVASLARSATRDDVCELCARPFGTRIYLPVDEVTGQKRRLCDVCALNHPTCYLCGLPAPPAGRTDLPDGRVICARDSTDAVLSEQEAARICDEVRSLLNRELGRFMVFSEANLTVRLVDRVTIQGMFKVAGNDYPCPNVWGFHETSTNQGRLAHRISLLAGLPPSLFRSTCAHELTHVWIHDQVSDARLATLGRDAHEGYCELVAHLRAKAENDSTALRSIEKNAYTRGQIQLFVAAERQFGMHDVVEWMKFGSDRALRADDLGRIREISKPTLSASVPEPMAAVAVSPAPESPAPDRLILRAVSAGSGAWAQINNRSFRVGEEWPVRIGASNVVVKCLAIRADSVTVELVNAKEKVTLQIGAP